MNRYIRGMLYFLLFFPLFCSPVQSEEDFYTADFDENETLYIFFEPTDQILQMSCTKLKFRILQEDFDYLSNEELHDIATLFTLFTLLHYINTNSDICDVLLERLAPSKYLEEIGEGKDLLN